ncbi:MAG TPA: HEAT repeat domain-containing protein [Gemmatimonadaceae bacterium]|nr:HEAT repeat domain-containing protein [Gemmatimonadaceae bacterium]
MRSTLHLVLGAACALVAGSRTSVAQSLAERVASSDGRVAVIYPSRPSVCGDGRGSIRHLFGYSQSRADGVALSSDGEWDERPCVHGPARAIADVQDGQVIRLRLYVGPDDGSVHANRTVNASVDDASAWLRELISRSEGRVASDAVVALLAADAPPPWPFLLRTARDERLSHATRSSALFWIGAGVIDKLGLDDARARTDDDQTREAAVFALTQGSKSQSVPDLIDLARNGKYPSVRRSAIFWLGQSGDPRAADVYADLLGVR